jgi:hypothetical protein
MPLRPGKYFSSVVIEVTPTIPATMAPQKSRPNIVVVFIIVCADKSP